MQPFRNRSVLVLLLFWQGDLQFFCNYRHCSSGSLLLLDRDGLAQLQLACGTACAKASVVLSCKRSMDACQPCCSRLLIATTGPQAISSPIARTAPANAHRHALCLKDRDS